MALNDFVTYEHVKYVVATKEEHHLNQIPLHTEQVPRALEQAMVLTECPKFITRLKNCEIDETGLRAKGVAKTEANNAPTDDGSSADNESCEGEENGESETPTVDEVVDEELEDGPGTAVYDAGPLVRKSIAASPKPSIQCDGDGASVRTTPLSTKRARTIAPSVAASVVGSPSSNQPKALTVKSTPCPPGVDIKEHTVKEKTAGLNLVKVARGYLWYTARRWVSDTKDRWLADDRQCPYAKQLKEHLDAAECAANLTKEKVLTNTNLGEDVRILKENALFEFEPWLLTLLTERAAKDEYAKEDVFDEDVIGPFRIIAPMTDLSENNPNPSGAIDPSKPQLHQLPGLTPEARSDLFLDYASKYFVPSLTHMVGLKGVRFLKLLENFEEHLSSIDLALPPPYINAIELLLVVVRSLIANVDSSAFSYYSDVKHVLSNGEDLMKKKHITKGEILIRDFWKIVKTNPGMLAQMQKLCAASGRLNDIRPKIDTHMTNLNKTHVVIEEVRDALRDIKKYEVEVHTVFNNIYSNCLLALLFHYFKQLYRLTLRDSGCQLHGARQGSSRYDF